MLGSVKAWKLNSPGPFTLLRYPKKVECCIVQKQSFADDLQNRCSYRFRKFYRKAAVLEFLFNKNADASLPTLLNRDSNTAVFCEICKTFKNILFRTPPVATSVCLREKFSEYPRDIILGISIILCSIQQHHSWFENYKLCWLSISFLAFLSLLTKKSVL